MGTRYIWKCKGCGYAVDMSGGKDCGFFCYTQTFQCNTCKTLKDVEVSKDEWETDEWEAHYCPECKSLLNLWNANKKTCPNRGGKMIIDDKDWITDWD